MGALLAPALFVPCHRSNHVPRELNEFVERQFRYALNIAVGSEDFVLSPVVSAANSAYQPRRAPEGAYKKRRSACDDWA